MRIGISITYSTLFRGVQQEFSNVFFYSLPTAVTVPSDSLINELVATLRFMHSTSVAFKRAAVWRADGSPASNKMIFQKALTGTGSEPTNASFDKERAFLFRWPAGFSTTGKPVYLRKWIHSSGNCAGYAATGGVMANTDEIATATRTALAATADELRFIGGIEQWALVSKSGRETTGPAECHRFLEHHQLGDMWR